MSRLWSLISVGARAGLLGGAVYFTAKKGIWSSSNEDGAKALTEFRENVIPATNDYIKQAPKAEAVAQSVKSKWNSGVEWTAEGIANLPSKVSQCSKDTVNFVVESVKSTRSK